MIKITHIISSLGGSFGGPSRSVPAMCNALSKYAEVTLFTIESQNQVRTPDSFNVRAFPSSMTFLPLACSAELRLGLQRDACDIYNANGLWQMPTHYAIEAACLRDKPVVVAPRGMLEPSALKFSRWKKHLSGWLWQRRDLRCVNCIHVTSIKEAENCRKYGLLNPLSVVPNGLGISDFPLKEQTGRPRQKRKLLFVGRLHPIKGLRTLLDAWYNLNKYHDEWQLVIAGNDDGGHESELKRHASNLGLMVSEKEDLHANVVFSGPVWGNSKILAYQDADLFVLPTLSENFGMVIAEALACGTPVITTKGAPWEQLPSVNAGWWIDIGLDPLIGALDEAMQCSREKLDEMGRNGRKLVERDYSIDSVAKRMMAVYNWCLNGRNQPDCVITD